MNGGQKQQLLQYHQTTSTDDLDFNNNNHNDKEVVNNPLNRGPYFDISASKNVTALVGKTAYLNCRIKNLGNKTVSTLLFLSLSLSLSHYFILCPPFSPRESQMRLTASQNHVVDDFRALTSDRHHF